DVGTGDGGDGPGEAPAAGVEEGAGPEVDGVAGQTGLDDVGEGHQVGAAVAVDDPLRATGGTGGVVDGDRFLFVGGGGGDGHRGAGAQEGVVGIVVGAGVVDADDVEGGEIEGGDERLQLGVDEEEARARVGEDVPDFRRVQPGVDGDEDAAGGGHGEVGL